MENWEDTNWWRYLDENLRDLIKQSIDLVTQETEREKTQEVYKDYSFIVFPAAKAYEGFLKKLFLDMKLISNAQYYGDHFRIGRALSPTLPKRYRSGWVYGKLVGVCGNEELPMAMWDVWRNARNRIFHFFPQSMHSISLDEARSLVMAITFVMERALLGCKVG